MLSHTYMTYRGDSDGLTSFAKKHVSGFAKFNRDCLGLRPFMCHRKPRTRVRILGPCRCRTSMDPLVGLLGGKRRNIRLASGR